MPHPCSLGQVAPSRHLEECGQKARNVYRHGSALLQVEGISHRLAEPPLAHLYNGVKSSLYPPLRTAAESPGVGVWDWKMLYKNQQEKCCTREGLCRRRLAQWQLLGVRDGPGKV